RAAKNRKSGLAGQLEPYFFGLKPRRSRLTPPRGAPGVLKRRLEPRSKPACELAARLEPLRDGTCRRSRRREPPSKLIGELGRQLKPRREASGRFTRAPHARFEALFCPFRAEALRVRRVG